MATDPITTQRITDDLDRLLAVLPEAVRSALEPEEAREQLLEVVLDLGRVPEARRARARRSTRTPRRCASPASPRAFFSVTSLVIKPPCGNGPSMTGA